MKINFFLRLKITIKIKTRDMKEFTKKFHVGAIFLGGNLLGGNFQGDNFPGGNFLWGVFSGGHFPGGIFPRTVSVML